MLAWLKRWFLRFIGFEKVRSITISASLLDDLCQMARDAHPKEMIAFLSASKGNQKGHVHIDEMQLQTYTASTDSAQVWLHQLPTFTNIIGTIHSHPSSSRRPSSADLSFWRNYGMVHAIMGYPYTKHSISYYTKDGRQIRITER